MRLDFQGTGSVKTLARETERRIQTERARQRLTSPISTIAAAVYLP